jgi:crotonobetainyl-CoA:carnitine CoA-transferase CaiB-like acyl-CoA transferase
LPTPASSRWPRAARTWREALDRHDITFGVVSRLEDAPSDRQLRDNGIVRDIVLGNGERLPTIDSPIALRGAAKVEPRPAPALAEHSGEILRELGYSQADLERLRTAGSFG